MGKVKATPQFSEFISSFCKLMENAQKDYAWNYDEVNRMDRLTQDYLHKLELDGLDYKERAKVATQLAKCRQARREYTVWRNYRVLSLMRQGGSSYGEKNDLGETVHVCSRV